MKRIVTTDSAPPAIGPYSQAVWAGDLLFCSGQIPLVPETGALITGSIEAETEQALNNLKSVLEAAGLTMAHVVKTTVFLTDLKDFAKVNEVYGRHFPASPPARACVEVAALPKGARIEIEAVACRRIS